MWDGKTAAQGSSDGTDLPGGGHQYLVHTIKSDNAVWTGPLPWDKAPAPSFVVRGTIKMAGGLAGYDAAHAGGQMISRRPA